MVSSLVMGCCSPVVVGVVSLGLWVVGVVYLVGVFSCPALLSLVIAGLLPPRFGGLVLVVRLCVVRTSGSGGSR